MTYKEAVNFFDNAVDTVLVDGNGEEIAKNKKGSIITSVYKNKVVCRAVIDWENHRLKLITDEKVAA